MKLHHLDLFSGIGGFALALEMVVGKENVEHVFCDNEPFAQAILKKHWPNSQINGDIRQLTPNTVGCGHVHGEPQINPTETREQTFGKSSTACGRFEVDIITGGFPCQPFSQAGKRRGTEDDRHLWPEMLRVIREFHPRWVVGENVSGFVTWNDGLVLEQVHTDLESEGYEVQAFIIPAVSLNAPHRRDRVWITAHSRSDQHRGRRGQIREANSVQGINRKKIRTRRTGGTDKDATNTDGSGDRTSEFRDFTNWKENGKEPKLSQYGIGRQNQNVANTNNPRRERENVLQQGRFSDRGSDRGNREAWDKNWLEVATELCTVDDGLRYDVVGLDGRRDAKKHTLPGSTRPRPKSWRNAALKGAGNAIVPQVAAEVIRSMLIPTLSPQHQVT